MDIDMIARAREAVATFRDATREGRVIGFRQRDRLVMVLFNALDELAALASPVPPPSEGGIPSHICGICYHSFDQCSHCEASPVPPLREDQELWRDHSVALEFVREIAAKKCAADCGSCIRCRARKWLHTEASPVPLQTTHEHEHFMVVGGGCFYCGTDDPKQPCSKASPVPQRQAIQALLERALRSCNEHDNLDAAADVIQLALNLFAALASPVPPGWQPIEVTVGLNGQGQVLGVWADDAEAAQNTAYRVRCVVKPSMPLPLPSVSAEDQR